MAELRTSQSHHSETIYTVVHTSSIERIQNHTVDVAARSLCLLPAGVMLTLNFNDFEDESVTLQDSPQCGFTRCFLRTGPGSPAATIVCFSYA